MAYFYSRPLWKKNKIVLCLRKTGHVVSEHKCLGRLTCIHYDYSMLMSKIKIPYFFVQCVYALAGKNPNSYLAHFLFVLRFFYASALMDFLSSFQKFFSNKKVQFVSSECLLVELGPNQFFNMILSLNIPICIFSVRSYFSRSIKCRLIHRYANLYKYCILQRCHRNQKQNKKIFDDAGYFIYQAVDFQMWIVKEDANVRYWLWNNKNKSFVINLIIFVVLPKYTGSFRTFRMIISHQVLRGSSGQEKHLASSSNNEISQDESYLQLLSILTNSNI